MLLETVEYPKNLPFSVFFSNVAEEDFHYHNEMKMLFVLRGTANCKIHNVLYTLEEGDLLIVDTKDMHRVFDTSPDVLMLDLFVDLSFYTDLYPDIDYMIFACEDYSKNSSLKYQDLQKKISILKHHVAKTALTYIDEKDNISLLMDCINDLIFTLVNQFQGFFIEDHKFKADGGGSSDLDLSRMYKIIKYIYLNYDKRISLEDLADIVYLNPYYISHLIKNTSGLSFQNFLNYVRLEFAEKFLVENELTLTQISEFCGFSSLSYFNKCFKAWYNMTPAQYRAKLKPCERSFHGPFSEEMAIGLLEAYIIAPHFRKTGDLLAKSSPHMFIPVKYNYQSGKKFKKAFPVKISFSSDEDIFMLNYQKERLRQLSPSALVLDYRLLGKRSNQEILSILSALQSLGLPLQVAAADAAADRQAEEIIRALGIPLIPLDDSDSFHDETGNNTFTACSALASIIKNPRRSIPLSGQSISLFTREGLLTPFYSVYSLFSQIKGIITEQRDQYMIVKNKRNICILIFHEDKDSKLKVHIHIKDIQGEKFVVEKSYTQDKNCYETLKALNHPQVLADSMRAHIDAISAGIVKLSRLDAKESLDMDFDMEPGAFTFIEIRD